MGGVGNGDVTIWWRVCFIYILYFSGLVPQASL